jgi:transcriptional regulator with XRE-family HTH domain
MLRGLCERAIRAYSGARGGFMTRSRASVRGGRGRSVDASLSPGELRSRRLGLGLTQAELAVRLGVTANTLARWERGELRPVHPAEVARRLARIGRMSRTSEPSAGPHDRLSVHAIELLPSHNLPAELTTLIGRRQETTELVDLLKNNRLVTLTGAGGVGKTRLAVRAAAEVARTYSDGVCMVELASVADPTLVVGTVAMALGVREQHAQSLVVALAKALRPRQLLLVLDNCEHLVCTPRGDLATCPRHSPIPVSSSPPSSASSLVIVRVEARACTQRRSTTPVRYT